MKTLLVAAILCLILVVTFIWNILSGEDEE